jgi:DNA-binding NarL/FixJ family response regulator
MTSKRATPLQVFLVDDHHAVRQGLALLLERSGVRVSGEAGDCAVALAQLESVACDVAIIDLTHGAESGVALIRELHALRPNLPVLVYSMHEERGAVEEAMQAGARGYVSKRDSCEHFLAAVAEVAAGRTCLSPRVTQVVTDGLVARAQSGGGADALSARERQVYAFLGEGDSLAEIAQKLAVSPRTVQSYCSRILTKLGVDRGRRR